MRRSIAQVSLLFASIASIDTAAADQFDERLQRLESLVAEQQTQIEAQQREIEQLRARLTASTAAPTPSEADTTLDVVRYSQAVAFEDRVGRSPERPVVAGDFPGSIRISGTDISTRIGGFVKADLHVDNTTLDPDDLFWVNRISTTNDERNVRLNARFSRLNLEVRGDTDYGPFRVVVEGDFFGAGQNQLGNSSSFRLRNAYAVLGRLAAGQGWSTFSDVGAFPELLDFGGPAGKVGPRQPQVRWTQAWGERWQTIVALENPEGDIFDARPGSPNLTDAAPDLAGRLRYAFDQGHLQLGALARRFEADEQGTGDHAYGYGVNLSGRIELNERRENLVFQAAGGRGIARYFSGLAGSELDAVISPNGTVEVLPVFGGYIAYQQWWAPALRSTWAAGYTELDLEAFQPVETFESGAYGAANLIWNPADRVLLGVEVLYGERQNLDGRKDSAWRWTLGSRFDF